MPDSDFNGDGRDDILWRHDSGLLTNWLGTASGTFLSNHENFLAFVPNDWQIAGLGDLNGDGKSDILWRHDSGLVTNWLGTANGSFLSNDANFLAFVPNDWHIAGVGDLNGDGKSDILWRHDSGLVTSWLGTANGSFLSNDANFLVFVSNDWRITGIGDFNGDGNSDILWQGNGTVTNWLGTDLGGFLVNDAVALAPLMRDVQAIGDFNGDGRDDILLVDDWSFISAYLARADGSFDFDEYDPFADWWVTSIASIGDFNGDGADDILWRNGETLTSSLGVAGVEADFAPNPNFAASVPTSWQVQPNFAGFGMWDY